ncbi:MAG TPA: 2-phosphosulfolactate phosphatase [Anaerolineales bacterium]|nr:2-phosphosulfolactate phosphatase [Anaerolineales bacterium]
MKFHYTDLEACHTATGVVIVIDVIRAFTNAAYVFWRGAREIYPVGAVEEALELKTQIPGALACGEVGGLAPEGFDFGNSPTQTGVLDLCERTIIQRTSAGTQGIVRSANAEQIVAASFVVAQATAKYVQSLEPELVTFVITGQVYDGGAEDFACAEYLRELLVGSSPNPASFLERVKASNDAKPFYDPGRPQFPESDILHCTSLDRFDFTMPVIKENGRPVMRAVRP